MLGLWSLREGSSRRRDLLLGQMQSACGARAKEGDMQLDTYAGNLKRTRDESSRRFAGELRPGAVVMYTGKALRAMGQSVGLAGQARFVISACACDLCQLGRHVCLERPNGRHVARAAVRVVSAGEHHLDEGTPDQQTKDMGDLAKGMRDAMKKSTKISADASKADCHPKRWQDCKRFVRTLRARAYLVKGRPVMSAGLYLYMYELWRDGWRQGRKALRRKLDVTEHEKAKGASAHRARRRRDDAA
jgi:hypothetical protein